MLNLMQRNYEWSRTSAFDLKLCTILLSYKLTIKHHRGLLRNLIWRRHKKSSKPKDYLFFNYSAWSWTGTDTKSFLRSKVCNSLFNMDELAPDKVTKTLPLRCLQYFHTNQTVEPVSEREDLHSYVRHISTDKHAILYCLRLIIHCTHTTADIPRFGRINIYFYLSQEHILVSCFRYETLDVYPLVLFF